MGSEAWGIGLSAARGIGLGEWPSLASEMFSGIQVPGCMSAKANLVGENRFLHNAPT